MFVERVGVRVSGRILIFQSNAGLPRARREVSGKCSVFEMSEWATLVGIDCDTTPAHCALCAHRDP